MSVLGRTQPASSACGSRKRPMAGAQQCALPASSSLEETAWPGRARQGTQTGASGDSWALANHGRAATPRWPRPPAGVLSVKEDEVYLEFIHLTLWKPHWREQEGVWTNCHHNQGRCSDFSFYRDRIKRGDAPRRHCVSPFSRDACKAEPGCPLVPAPSD